MDSLDCCVSVKHVSLSLIQEYNHCFPPYSHLSTSFIQVLVKIFHQEQNWFVWILLTVSCKLIIFPLVIVKFCGLTYLCCASRKVFIILENSSATLPLSPNRFGLFMSSLEWLCKSNQSKWGYCTCIIILSSNNKCFKS